jgi:hypothetical protein
VKKQALLLREKLPALLPFYLESARAQLPLARALAEAPDESFDAIAEVVTELSAKKT